VWNLILAQAQEAAQGAGTAAGDSAATAPNQMSHMLFIFAAMIAIMYFLMIRPNQKREKERRDMLAALKKGDKVVTTGGVCGTVVGISEKSVVLRVSDEPSVKIEVLRGAVTQVTSRDEQE
jgi:preprotein translocase subunit YajC